MRLSCNGCRVLRKACSESCSIRPCLQWIKSPDAQSNATVFLAKFYGRAGLLNLINAGEESLRPAVFRSLLYEACGRIVNPVYGSVGLLWSGKWHMCRAAVDAVLKGAPIVRISDDEAAAAAHLLLPDNNKPAYPDIRHVFSDHHHNKKRKSSPHSSSATTTTCCGNNNSNVKKKKPKHQQQGSSVSDDHDHAASAVSLDSHVTHNQQVSIEEEQEQQQQSTHNDQQRLGLDLTLGFAPMPAAPTAGETQSITAAEPEPAGFVGFRFL